jgi:hypothetical protein
MAYLFVIRRRLVLPLASCCCNKTAFLKSPNKLNDFVVMRFLEKSIVVQMKEISSLLFLFLELKSALQFSQSMEVESIVSQFNSLTTAYPLSLRSSFCTVD